MTQMETGTLLTTKFDIVQKYNSILSSEPDLTPPIAAIESLVAALTASPATTISETLSLLQTSATTLRQAVPNWIALSAGTDLFQRYLVTTLQRPGALGPGGDFGLLKQHLLSNSRLFVQRAKEARGKIAKHGSPFILDDKTVLTNGGSRVVSALLRYAAESGRYFNVIYVLPSSSKDVPGCEATVTTLRSLSVPVATIPESAVAYALATKVDMAIVGAEGVVENGGIISRLGTYQIGLLAKAMGKPFYVASESYKFVRMYPLGQDDLPIEQNIIKFAANAEQDLEKSLSDTRKTEPVTDATEEFKDCVHAYDITEPLQRQGAYADAVDYTPPHLIAALITENGILTPSAVSEEVIKLWF
jgi:translation initiation factor eIF-2B subunit alpha